MAFIHYFSLLPFQFPSLQWPHPAETFQIIQTNPAMALQPTMDAPKFKGTAVVNGMFKEISLDDYKGKVLVDI